MFCPNCGKELNDNVKFCDACGTEIIRTQEPNADYVQPIILDEKPKNDGFAIASLVLGIASLLCCGGITAILSVIFGAISISKSKRLNNKSNGMAIAGLVLGIVSLVMLIVFVASGAYTEFMNGFYEGFYEGLDMYTYGAY